MILPPEAIPPLAEPAPVLTQPTARRFVTRLLAAIPTAGHRTVANPLHTLGGLAPGHRSDYQRALSRALWSAPDLGRAPAGSLLRHAVPDGRVFLVGDDTVGGHPGGKVCGKARHRDPVRSTRGHTAWRYGHEWVALAVPVRSPFAARPWALPVLVDLDRSPGEGRCRQRPHRTPARLMCLPPRLMRIRFPERQFLFVGDAGYGAHEVARFCRRHRGRWTPVSEVLPKDSAPTSAWKPPGVVSRDGPAGGPCLFGLYSVVALLDQASPPEKRRGAIAWPGKAAVTFSDASTAVGRWLWDECVFPQEGGVEGLERIPEPRRAVLLAALAPAA